MKVSKQERKNAFRFIVALGFVSLFADMTYEGAHSVIGPLLKDLGASATQVGIIAGLGEMIAASLRCSVAGLINESFLPAEFFKPVFHQHHGSSGGVIGG